MPELTAGVYWGRTKLDGPSKGWTCVLALSGKAPFLFMRAMSLETCTCRPGEVLDPEKIVVGPRIEPPADAAAG